jgi:glycosyltransferase involved in cell wall biosynthesis
MKNLTICHVNLAKGFRGGERQTELLIRHLSDSVAAQYLVCRRNSPLIEHLRDVKNLTAVEVSGRFGGHFSNIRADIINAHEAKAAHWALIEHTLRGTPYVITRRVPQKIKKGVLSNLCYSRASRLVGISSPITEYLKEISSRPVVTINSALAHMSCDLQKTSSILNEYQNKIIIGHIGAYVDRHKGQRIIIEAARQLAKERDDLVFLCLGAGCDEQVLREESCDVPSVKWLGFQKDVGSYLKAFRLFVFPSRNEGLGSTLLDVMDYGIPVIASNVDGIPDIVKDYQTGLLIENGSATQLAEKIRELLNDSELAGRLAQNAKSSLENFLPETMASRYIDMYQSILQEGEHNR